MIPLFRRRLLPVAALAVGSAPGFLLPIALVWSMTAGGADTLLLAISMSQFAASLTATTLEAHLVARFSGGLTRGEGPSGLSMGQISRWSLVSAGVTTILVAPIVALVYSAGSDHITWAGLVLGCWPLLLVPLVATQASKWSALLLAHKRLSTTYVGNFFRGGLTLAAALLWPSLTALAFSYFVGELARLFFYRWRAQRLLIGSNANSTRFSPSLSSLLHQSGSLAISQTGPLIVRALLAAGPPGSVAIAEIASRVLVAANQVAASSLNMHAVVQLPSALAGRRGRSTLQILLGQGSRLFAWNAALAVVVAAAVASLLVVGGNRLPADVNEGFTVALFLLVSVPFISINFWATRTLLLASKLWPLTPVAVVAVVVTSGAGFALFYSGAGPAVILATAVGYVVGAIMSVTIVLRIAPKPLEAEFPDELAT